MSCARGKPGAETGCLHLKDTAGKHLLCGCGASNPWRNHSPHCERFSTQEYYDCLSLLLDSGTQIWACQRTSASKFLQLGQYHASSRIRNAAAKQALQFLNLGLSLGRWRGARTGELNTLGLLLHP